MSVKQKEIMRNWNTDELELPKVSVICLTYNQEKYIRQCLDSFLMQRTDFVFEVIIHDDASTDGTTDIIKYYEKEYPLIIKPIYETENQYSKHDGSLKRAVYSQPKGKYLAYCEGDDFWTDPNKLQMQVDYMENHPSCSMCVHNTCRISEDGQATGRNINISKKERDYSIETIIEMNVADLFHTSSKVVKKDVFLDRPNVFTMPTIGDYPMSIWMSLNGSVHYFPAVMSAYRQFSSSSWTNRVLKDQSAKKRFVDGAIASLKKMDDYTDQRYHKAFKRSIMSYRYMLLDRKRKVLYSFFYPVYFKKILFAIYKKIVWRYTK